MISFISDPVEEAPPPQVYRNDRGQIVPKSYWEKEQAAKQKAEAGGYVRDEFSQL